LFDTRQTEKAPVNSGLRGWGHAAKQGVRVACRPIGPEMETNPSGPSTTRADGREAIQKGTE